MQSTSDFDDNLIQRCETCGCSKGRHSSHYMLATSDLLKPEEFGLCFGARLEINAPCLYNQCTGWETFETLVMKARNNE